MAKSDKLWMSPRLQKCVIQVKLQGKHSHLHYGETVERLPAGTRHNSSLSKKKEKRKKGASEPSCHATIAALEMSFEGP